MRDGDVYWKTESNMTKKTFKLSGLHCTSCSMLIEGELEDQLGVKAACNYARQVLEVEFDPGRVTDEHIVEVVEKQGYKVMGRG